MRTLCIVTWFSILFLRSLMAEFRTSKRIDEVIVGDGLFDGGGGDGPCEARGDIRRHVRVVGWRLGRLLWCGQTGNRHGR